MENAVELYEEEIAGIGDSIIRNPIGPLPNDPNGITRLNIEEWNGVKYYVEHKTMPVIKVDTLLTVKWNQCSPYNYYCPEIPNAGGFCNGRAVAGCGPVAVAQIMSYYRYPNTALSTTFNWNAIMTAPSYYYFDFSDASLATAYLIKKIGETCDAKYGPTTSSQMINLSGTFILYGYAAVGSENFSDTKVQNSLQNSRPVLTSGHKGEGGHGWVIDGYNQHKMVTTYYYMTPPYNVFRKQTDWQGYYYHCNWGWGGLYDGWFLSTFDGYNKKNKILYNIRPNQ